MSERLMPQFQVMKSFQDNTKKFPFLVAIINKIVIFIIILIGEIIQGVALYLHNFYQKSDTDSQQFLFNGEGICCRLNSSNRRKGRATIVGRGVLNEWEDRYQDR
jgi:hypothetical protein